MKTEAVQPSFLSADNGVLSGLTFTFLAQEAPLSVYTYTLRGQQ